MKITAESIKAVLNKHAPKIEPKGIRAVVPESLDPAIMAVMTSGAPFAKAKNVTPANVGEISINDDKQCTELFNELFYAR